MNFNNLKMFNLPNLMTAMNMVCGILAIIFSLIGRIDLAPWFLFTAAILDFFDGFVARLLKIQSELGKQLDSLADVVSFGLAPGVMMFVFLITYSYLNYDILGLTDLQNYKEAMISFTFALQDLNYETYNPFLALVIPVFSMFRLAKFNIDVRQSDSFIGLPTPANTIFFTSFPLILIGNHLSDFELSILSTFLSPLSLSIVIILMSILLVAELPLFSLKFKDFSINKNLMKYVFLGISLILIFAVKFWAIPLIIILYVILSIISVLTINKNHEV